MKDIKPNGQGLGGYENILLNSSMSEENRAVAIAFKEPYNENVVILAAVPLMIGKHHHPFEKARQMFPTRQFYRLGAQQFDRHYESWTNDVLWK